MLIVYTVPLINVLLRQLSSSPIPWDLGVKRALLMELEEKTLQKLEKKKEKRKKHYPLDRLNV